jgi:hypothetical protein
MQSPLCFITAVQRLGKSCILVWTPSFLMCLITQVTSLDTSSMLLKRFPRSGFFSFGNKSKSGGLSPPEFDFFPKLKKPMGWAHLTLTCSQNWRNHWAEPTRLWLLPKIEGTTGLSPSEFDLFPKLKEALGWAHLTLTCSQNWRNHWAEPTRLW